MKSRARSGAWLELAWNAILAFLGFALVYYLRHFHPVGYVYCITEDYCAEYATFVSWAVAFCFLAWTLFKHKVARKPGIFLLGLGTFFVAMEEISWGQRILGFHSPAFFTQRNLQGETTLHNLIPLPSYSPVGIAIFLWSILLPLVTRRSMRLRRWCSQLGIPVVPIRQWPFFLLAIYFFMYAPTFDRKELAEAYLSIAISALSLDLALTMGRGGRPRGAIAAVATTGMILTLGLFTAVLVQFYPWPQKLTNSLNHFAASHYPTAGMPRQAEMLFDYMNRNPQFLTPETHYYHGQFLMRVGRHVKAKEILGLALAEQEQLQQRDPNDPAPLRNSGRILRLLGRSQESERAFLDAMDKDLARLDRANDTATKSSAHWSLAQTHLSLGESEAASQQFAMAHALAPDAKIRHRMGRLIKKWLRRSAVATSGRDGPLTRASQ